MRVGCLHVALGIEDGLLSFGQEEWPVAHTIGVMSLVVFLSVVLLWGFAPKLVNTV